MGSVNRGTATEHNLLMIWTLCFNILIETGVLDDEKHPSFNRQVVRHSDAADKNKNNAQDKK